MWKPLLAPSGDTVRPPTSGIGSGQPIRRSGGKVSSHTKSINTAPEGHTCPVYDWPHKCSATMRYPLAYRSYGSDWPLYTPSGALYRRPLSVMIDPFTIEPMSWERRDPLLESYPKIDAKYHRPEAWEYPRYRLHAPLLWDYPALRPHGQSYGYLWAKSRSWLSDWYNF